MKRVLAGICLALACLHLQASERWVFEDRIAVTGATQDSVYHHLDGAGRKHIAVNGDRVAIAWEDNRSGDPQVYVTLKATAQQGFAAAMLASTGSEAYEPSISAVAGNRFVVAFEQDGAVYARLLSAQGLAEPIRLSAGAGGHASIASADDRVFASWRERADGRWYIQVASLRLGASNRLSLESQRQVEADGLENPVLFPSLAVNKAGLCIAWEDRRAGHTRLLFAHADVTGGSFGEPQSLNEFFSNRNQYDRGSGVTRVSLASFGEDEMLAAWMDKRRGGKGYGIFAALGAEGGDNFGPNEKVHGEQGDTQPHYNPATTGNRGADFAVAWDDFRRGDSDVWINFYSDDLEWSEDFSPGVASGPGEQSHPSIALDEQGGLHLLWIERDDVNGPSRLWYSSGQSAR